MSQSPMYRGIVAALFMSSAIALHAREVANEAAISIYRIAVSGASWSSNPKVRAALSKLEGVAGVKFNCKIATVTMKAGGKLEESAAEAALEGAGFGVKSFESGAGVTVGLVRLKVKDFEPTERDSIVEAAQVAIKGPAFVSVSDTGDLVVVMKDGKAPAVEKIQRAFAATEQKVEVSDVTVSDISVGYQRYSVELDDVSDAEKARAAAAGCDGVLAVTIDKAAKKLDLVTPEPCPNLEAKLGKALAPAGAKIVKLEAT